MNKPNHALTKTCINCGLQKPLSAFLQFSSTHGATYGNVCSSCRKAHQEKVDNKEPDEKTRREAGGSKIRAGERLAGEIDKRQTRERIDRLYREDLKKDEKQNLERIQKVETNVKSERTHREGYLEKRSFLDSRDKLKRVSIQEQTFGSEERKAKDAEIRLDAPLVEDFGKEKYKTSFFGQFKAWLGSNASIVAATERSQNKPGSASTSNTKAAAVGEKSEESLVDTIRKTWGTGSKRS